MNIAKKLLFALLLCGATFAVACEDEGGGDDGAFTGAGTAGKDAACKKTPTKAEEKCKTDYACVPDSATANAGKCHRECTAANVGQVCTEANTGAADKTSCEAKGGFEATKKNVCVKPSVVEPQKLAVTGDCSANTAKCEDGLECVTVGTEKKCLLKCSDVSGCSDASKAGADHTACEQLPKKGSTTEQEKVCTKPAPKLTVGGDCSGASAECGDDLECVDATPSHSVCAFKCSDNTGCTDPSKAGQGMVLCQQINKKGSTTEQEKVCGPVLPVKLGKECNKLTGADAKTCDTNLVCVGAADNAETGTCKHTCTVDNDCTNEKGGTACKDVLAAKVVSASQADTKVCDAP